LSIFVVNRIPKKTFVAAVPLCSWRHPPNELLFLFRLSLYRRRILHRLLLHGRLTRGLHDARVPGGTDPTGLARGDRRPTCRSA
jgi:hypothetical protein